MWNEETEEEAEKPSVENVMKAYRRNESQLNNENGIINNEMAKPSMTNRKWKY